MPHYKTKKNKIRTSSRDSEDSGYDSGYESDGGTKYSPVKNLGSKGDYAQARLFQSRSNKAVAVLNPVVTPGDIEEARVKRRFFQTVYPEKQSYLFNIEKGMDYRLVVPYIPHIPYKELIIDNPKLQKILFGSAVNALKDCHDKGIIVLDLKSDNIYYDSSTQKSYLIDGGLSVPTGTGIEPLAFQKSNQDIVEQHKKDYNYKHISPECWSVDPNIVLATPQMDIYALGVLMSDLLKNPDSEIQSLIDSCLENDPKKRPTLVDLIVSLDLIQEIENAEEGLAPFKVFR
ncbi:MAG: protein kinase family protein [Legionella sp.]|uniref:protein kinase family protein n=1 Tax=Legionella sp. TaxID=459 RepID=UPI0039E5D79D